LLGDAPGLLLLSASGINPLDQGVTLKRVFGLHVSKLCVYAVLALLQILNLILIFKFFNHSLHLLSFCVVLLLGEVTLDLTHIQDLWAWLRLKSCRLL